MKSKFIFNSAALPSLDTAPALKAAIAATVIMAAALLGATTTHAQTSATAKSTTTITTGAFPVKVTSTTTTTTTHPAPIIINTTSVRTVKEAPEIVLQPIETTTYVEVDADASLNAYANAMSKVDASVRTVEISDSTKVTVEYTRPAKLFGFIDATYTETATVEANGNTKPEVSVKKPWWTFLASTDRKTDDFSASLKSRVEANASLSSKASFSSADKAQVLADINASAQAAYGVR